MIELGIIGSVLLVSLFIYNSLIGHKNEVENAQGGLDAQLKQRYDLIPNLVSSVKNFMTHESALLQKIVDLRTDALKPNTPVKKIAEINSEIAQGLSGLLVQVEAYPELKSSSHFLELQRSLYEVEENIAASRRFFNSAVTEYNTAIETFPSNMMAKLMRLKRKDVFNIPELERRNVDVSKLFTDKVS